jgi:hypothetical protein
MPQTSLNDFKTNFDGGTRQNRFYIEGTIPFGNGAVSSFHVRSTLIPTLQTSTIAYDYMGRKSYFPGEKMYSTWSVSVIDDPSSQYDLWAKFNIWQNNINNHETNRSDISLQTGTFASYKANGWKINHLDLNGNIIKTFVLNGCWPRSINEINFNMSRPNVINTFNVVFVFDSVEIYTQDNPITARY